MAFPQYKIHNSFGALRVRTSGFTLTDNVQINANPEKGIVRTQTNKDMVFSGWNLPLIRVLTLNGC